jgi:hypothetical protein
VAPARSKRQSRKRRKPRGNGRVAQPERRAPRPARPVRPAGEDRREQGALGVVLTGKVYGERPASPFGGLPVSEIAIFAGIVGVIVGVLTGSPAALATGVVVCTLGVVEVTAREHFSGYRSHATLLAAVPAVAIGIAIVAVIGHGSLRRGLSGPNRAVLLVIVPVFALLFWLLSKRFRAARQARIVRPPGP